MNTDEAREFLLDHTKPEFRAYIKRKLARDFAVHIAEQMRAIQTDEHISDDMLTAAVQKACRIGIFPGGEVDEATYLRHWDGMKQCLHAAMMARGK